MATALERANMLEALYTDICGNVGPGRWLAPLRALGGKKLGKLLDRRPPSPVADRTRTFPRWTIDMLKAGRAASAEQRVRLHDRAHRNAAKSMIKSGFGNATHVLVELMEARGVLTAAKQAGLVTITDVNVAPSAERIVREERRRNPGWEADGLYYGETLDDPAFRPLAETLSATDLFLCPSSFVQDDLVSNFAVPREKTILLPYAANPKWFDVDPETRAGQIFFAGEAGIRKGIHVLAEAARILEERGHSYEFRIAGSASETVRSRGETDRLTFLGRLSHDEMRHEFATADLFAFPSFAEGSAGVTFEAMGAGVPLVTTQAAGSVARDGIEGLIVPEGDANGLADAIEQVVENRELRNRLADGARLRAREFSWQSYADRLPQAIAEFQPKEG